VQKFMERFAGEIFDPWPSVAAAPIGRGGKSGAHARRTRESFDDRTATPAVPTLERTAPRGSPFVTVPQGFALVSQCRCLSYCQLRLQRAGRRSARS
jgi:hypothetical protein